MKVVARRRDRELLGLHIVGNGASASSPRPRSPSRWARSDDLRLTIHPHPTLPEAIMEAAEGGLDEAMHIHNR